MDVRDATEADLPAILSIINDATPEHHRGMEPRADHAGARRAWWQERIAGGLSGAGRAEVDGRCTVLGFASYGTFRPWEGYKHTVEHSVYVDARGARQGVGRALLAALIEHATGGGKHIMVAGIDAGNPSRSVCTRRSASPRRHAAPGRA